MCSPHPLMLLMINSLHLTQSILNALVTPLWIRAAIQPIKKSLLKWSKMTRANKYTYTQRRLQPAKARPNSKALLLWNRIVTAAHWQAKCWKQLQTTRPQKNLSSHLSFNCEGRWGTTDDFATSFLHFCLFSTSLLDLVNSRPVHSEMLSSHLFLCLPCLFPLFTVPCKMVLARPDERETWPYHCSLHLFTIVRSSCGQIACWILTQTF